MATSRDMTSWAFLDQIDRHVEPALEVHVICDNLSTHWAVRDQAAMLNIARNASFTASGRSVCG
jgi:hypothetical protein